MSGVLAFERVGIVGLGLMGGSLARALRLLDDGPRVVAFNRNPEHADQALVDGVIDAVAFTAEEAVEGGSQHPRPQLVCPRQLVT